MYISRSFKSFVRRLLGNGKWYQLHLRSRWHYQFSSKCKKIHTKGIFKIVKSVYKRENLGLSAEQVIGGFHARLFGNGCHNHETSTKKRHFMEWTKWLRTWLSPNGLFINEIFSWDGFHCNTYSLNHILRCFSFFKIRIYLKFRVNCNKSLTDVLVKPLPVQKSICLLILLLNHPENKGNTT